MVVLDFVIPSDKDDLLQPLAGKYCVKKLYQLREIEKSLADARTVLQEEGCTFILDHFDMYFSILVHGANLKVSVHTRAVDQIYKCLDIHVDEVAKAFDKNKEPYPDDKLRFICTSKMLAYLLSQFIRHIEGIGIEESTGQGKRAKPNSKSEEEKEWYEKTDEILVLVYQWIQLPLEKLWQPPIADASFVMSIADMCYRILERCKTAKSKSMRESIFQILGTLVKRYNHGISCVVKIIQLVKICDGLAPHLATGIIQLIEETGSTGIIKEMLREIDRAAPEEGGTRNIANFLETVASLNPQFILPAITNMTDHLANECYLMRNCVLGILGTIVKDILTSENLSNEQRMKRDECLDNLMEHILDSNAFVRAKALQVWQNLCAEGAVPLANQNVLLEATILRLDDKGASVRKYAFQLLKTLLQCNPFAGKFKQGELQQKLTDKKLKLKVLERKIVRCSEPKSKIRTKIWKSLVPAIRDAIQKTNVEEHLVNDPEEISDLDTAFENVRYLLLEEKVHESIKLLLKITSKLPGNDAIDKMIAEEQEQYIMSLLHKIFIESQEAGGATAEQSNSNGDDDEPNEREKNRRKLQEEYEAEQRLFEYTESCTTFSGKLVEAVPIAEAKLNSVVASDAIEACSFLGVAYQFDVQGAKSAIRKALCQVFSRDVSVRENLAEVYRELFIGDNERYQSDRQKALSIVKALIKIVKTLEPGQSPALVKLLTTWLSSKVLGPDVFQVMWEQFSLKLPETSPGASRAALMLLTMVAETEPAIFTDNFDILVTVGLGPRAENDLLLARDTCRAMTKVQVQSADPLKPPSRLSNDHQAFERLLLFLVGKFSDWDEPCYTTFSTEAINAIYHLADQPGLLMKDLLCKLIANFQPANGATQKSQMSSTSLANLFHIVGHIAIREMIHLDTAVFKEMKRRNMVAEKLKTQKKTDSREDTIVRTGNRSICPSEVDTPSTASRMRRAKDTSTVEDNGEAALEGATADDADAEFIYNVLENEVVSGDGLLAKFVPLVLAVCQQPVQYPDEELQIAASLALSKMMTVSSSFCKEYLQLLVTIMERSPSPSNRANILIGMTDLMHRFPNEVEPWNGHIYGRLEDESPSVRRTCVKMLSNLILREMVRVKGQVAQLAVCLIDPEEVIRQEATQFFNELANKANALYNIMPDILSRLTNPDLNLEEDKFRQIIKFILSLIQKEKQVDTIIEKICIRFKLAVNERQWRDLSYCLSQLKFNTKGIQRLIDNLNLIKDKIHHDPVLKVFQSIIDQAKKKTETKAVALELEERLERLLTCNNDTGDSDKDEEREKEKGTKKGRRRRTEVEKENINSDSEFMPPPLATRSSKRTRTKTSARL
ncbi:condensin complex subunit 1 isoform X1 [Athalia rosae]|uniref:condensin complex subunit 1 isoform X1 n=1 Tax=Athalia rosae TaxID=37344 RepID=UPI0020333C8D|nr:condensin complex subunit 1 isoform X1 [Athalia rosae]